MKAIPQRRKVHSEMLPLMDMIFLLLVIFIFMIVQMRPNFGVNVELPDIGKESLTKPDNSATPIVVAVTNENKLFVNGEPCIASEIISKISQLSTNREAKDISIILRGDKHANYGEMIKLFTLFRTNGINEILFDVERK